MDDHATLARPDTLVIRRWLPGPVERIWDYLTKDDLRRQWLAAGEMSEAPFDLVWRNDDLSDADDPRPEGFKPESRLTSRVIEAVPPHRLVIAWDAGDVTFELAPKADRVLLTLTHRGIPDEATRIGVSAGWHTHLDILVAKAEGSTPPSFWGMWQRMRDDYRARLR